MADLNELGDAIARHPNPVQVMFLGFDLWTEVYISGKIAQTFYKQGGVPVSPEEAEGIVAMPVPTVAGIAVSLDPTLPPDGFRLAP